MEEAEHFQQLRVLQEVQHLGDVSTWSACERCREDVVTLGLSEEGLSVVLRWGVKSVDPWAGSEGVLLSVSDWNGYSVEGSQGGWVLPIPSDASLAHPPRKSPT